MKHLKCFSVLAFAGVLNAAAATYYSGGSSPGSGFGIFKWYDDATRKVLSSPQPTPTANDGNTYVLLTSAKPNGTVAFPEGTFVQMGMPDGSSAFLAGNCNCSSVNWTIPNCKVYGLWYRPNWANTGTFSGNYELVKTSKAIEIGSNSLPNGARYGVVWAGTFSGANDVVVSLVSGPSTWTSTGITQVRFTGDFSAYKGNIDSKAMSYYADDVNYGYVFAKFESATSMGDPTEERSDAIVLRHRSHLYIGPKVTQSDARGITFSLAPREHAALRTDANENWTLTAPVSGTDGTVRKVGPGTLTMAGRFSVTNLVAAEGILVLDEGSTFTTGTKLVVKDGAKVVVRRSAALSEFTVEKEEGGVISYIVPYVDATRTATPLLFDAQALESVTYPIGICLAEEIALPVNEPLRLRVLSFAADVTRSFVPADFICANNKVCGLPTTNFEIGTDDAGRTCVDLVVKAAISQTGVKWGVESTSAVWSDGSCVEKAGGDYFMINGISTCDYPRTKSGSNIANYNFLGDSYTIRGQMTGSTYCTLGDYAGVLTITDLRMYRNSQVNLIRASSSTALSGGVRERAIEGNIFVDSTSTLTTYPATINSANTTNRNDLNANLLGSGTLRLFTMATSADDAANGASAEHPTPFTIRGDNSRFAGQFFFHANSASSFVRYAVTNACAFGGPLDALRGDAVLVNTVFTTDKLVSIAAESDIDVNAANRGWSITSASLYAPSNVTFTFRAPLTLKTKLIKDGAGTLAFGPSSVTVTAADGLPFVIDEGYVQPLDSNAFTNLNVTISDGAGFKVGAESAYGVRAKSIAATGRISIWAVVPETQPTVFKVVLCTVPEENEDLSAAFTFVKQDGYVTSSRSLEKEVLTGDDAGFVRYTMTYTHPGCCIIFR